MSIVQNTYRGKFVQIFEGILKLLQDL
jgi:hypothetical protein